MSFNKENTQSENAVESNGEKNSEILITSEKSGSIHAIEPHLGVSEEKIELKDQVCETPHLAGIEGDIAKPNVETNSSKTLQNVSQIIPEQPLISAEQNLSSLPCLKTSGEKEFLENVNKKETSKASNFVSHNEIVEEVEFEQSKLRQLDKEVNDTLPHDAPFYRIKEEIDKPDEEINDGLPHDAQMYIIKENNGQASLESNTVELTAKLNESKGFHSYLQKFLLKEKCNQSLTESIMEAAQSYEHLDRERRVNNEMFNTFLSYCKALTKKIIPTTANNDPCVEEKRPPESPQNDDTVYGYEEVSSGDQSLPTTNSSLHLINLQSFGQVFPELDETSFDEPSKQLLENQFETSQASAESFVIPHLNDHLETTYSSSESCNTEFISSKYNEENFNTSFVIPHLNDHLEITYSSSESCNTEFISSNNEVNFNASTSFKIPGSNFSITENSSHADSERTQGERSIETEESLSESNVRCFLQAPAETSFPYPSHEDCCSEVTSNVSRRTTRDRLRQKNFRSKWSSSSRKNNKKDFF